MSGARAVAWVERLIWILIYGGILLVILGIVAGGTHLIAGWSLGAVGAAAITGGVVLIWVRSRMQEPPTEATARQDPPR
jgi:hypothetical protein